MGQRLLSKEVDNRVDIKLDKSIKKQGVNGIMCFGADNDYPQLIEKLIAGSTTAKAVSRIYSKFIVGFGFENESINDVVIDTDPRGKAITLKTLLRQTADNIADHNGFYWWLGINAIGEVNKVHIKPFKGCRFAKPDDIGYSAKIAYYSNWTKEITFEKFDKNKINAYHVYNPDQNAINAQIKDSGGLDKYKGQIYFQFLDDRYFYPISNFDAVYLDCDTEAQIALYKNRQIRDGFFDKIIVRTHPGGTIEEQQEFAEELENNLGPNGKKVTIMWDDVDENGNIRNTGAFLVDKLPSNVNDKLFVAWEKGLSNNIRKSGGKGMPAILIDYEENKLSQGSGESVVQATNFYNAITQDDRTLIENSFREIFSKSTNGILRNNDNWKIKPLELFAKEIEEKVDQAQAERLKAQATLKGSVGGVQALIQLQQSVSQKTTTVESAIEIIKEIYGISEDVAKRMIGNPEINTNGTTDNTGTASL